MACLPCSYGRAGFLDTDHEAKIYDENDSLGSFRMLAYQ